MAKKLFILIILTIVLTTSCAQTDTKINQDPNNIPNETITSDITQIENKQSNQLEVTDINISERITPINNNELEVFVSKNTIFFPTNIEATLASISIFGSETTAEFYLKGYTPTSDNSARIENNKNQILLTWITNNEIDIQYEFNRTYEDGYKYLDEKQTYIYKDYQSMFGVMKKQIVWMDYGTLFTLTIPASLYNETSNLEIFKVEVSQDIDIIKNSNASTEKIENESFIDVTHIHNNSDVVIEDPEPVTPAPSENIEN